MLFLDISPKSQNHYRQFGSDLFTHSILQAFRKVLSLLQISEKFKMEEKYSPDTGETDALEEPNQQLTTFTTNQFKIYSDGNQKAKHLCSFTSKNWIVAGTVLLLTIIIVGVSLLNRKLVYTSQQKSKTQKQAVTAVNKPRKGSMFNERISKKQSQQQSDIRYGVISATESPQHQQNYFYGEVGQQFKADEQYEYDVNGNFSLWDMTPAFKKRLFESYKDLNQNRKIADSGGYMQINYGNDQQFQKFAKKFEENVDIINWYQIRLRPIDIIRVRSDFNIALQIKRARIYKLLQKYKQEYRNKTGQMDSKKNISFQRFLQSLQYERLTGENFRKIPRLKRIYQSEKDYYRKVYQTDKTKTEIHSCIVIPTYNNVIDHRYLWNLESILQQDYQNYRLIIIDDASYDSTARRIAEHLKWRGVDKKKVILLRNKRHQSALPNIYYAVHKYCDYNQIFYILDGDDEIVGTQVFKLYNSLYQQKKGYVLYSSHFQYESQNETYPLPLGLPFAYPEEIKKSGKYRTFDHAYSQLRTVMSDLVLLINTQSLKDQNGQFYWTISDNALFFPAMEMSCGRVEYIPELEYWYNANTGINDWRTPNQNTYIRAKKHINFVQRHYQCIHKTIKEIKKALNYSSNT